APRHRRCAAGSTARTRTSLLVNTAPAGVHDAPPSVVLPTPLRKAAYSRDKRVFQKRRLDNFGRRVTAPVRLAHARVDVYYRVRVMGAAARRRWLPLLGS